MFRSLGLLALLLLSATVARSAAAREVALEHTSRIVLALDERRGASARITEAARAVDGRLVEDLGGQVSVDVPSARYRELLDRLRRLGRLSTERLTSRDLTARIATAAAAVAAAQERRQRLQRVSGIARNVSESLALEREQERAASELASAEGRLRDLQRRAGRTRVVVRVDAPAAEAIAPPKLPIAWLDELELPRLLDPSPRRRPTERDWVLRAFVDVGLTLELGHVAEPERLDGTSKTAALGTTLRGMGEANPIGLFGGVDWSLGYAGGFLYGLQLLGGVGVPIGRDVAVGLASGPGIDGVTGGVIPFGVRFPLELYVALDVTSLVYAAAWARQGWVLAAEARDDGSEHALFGDELAAGLTLGFGSRERRGYTGNRVGPVVGFAYRELMGTATYQLVLGLGAHHADYSF